MKREDIVIIGNGSFGTALATLFNNQGHNVAIWGKDEARTNYLKNGGYIYKNNNIILKLDNNIEIIDDLSSIKSYKIWIICISSNGIDELSKKLKEFYTNQIIVNTTKGLGVIESLEKNLSTNKIVELSGPTHAEEVVQSLVTLCVAGSKEEDLSNYIQQIFSSDVFRIYINNDIYGIELAAALKNIIAIAAGISDGIGYGDNAKAALMTRGLVEIKRLGLALGAKENTFNGLAGIGDLIVTCSSIHSRNRKYGFLLGQGYSHEEALLEINMVVEGLNSISSAYKLSKELNVEMPIVNEIYKIIYENKDPKLAIKDLMLRDLKVEN